MLAALKRVDVLGGGVRRLSLDADPDFRFDAGQYVRILHPTGLAIPFSVASAPERLPRFEIHFRPVAGAPDAEALLHLLARASVLEIDGPFGDVAVRGPTRQPLFLVAGGTGVAQCLAIVEHLCACAQGRPVRLLWSVSAPEHLYCVAHLETLAAGHPWFRYETAVDVPGGRNGACARIERDGVPEEGEVVLAGSPGFVYAVLDSIEASGPPCGRIRSDVFAYAPR